MKVGLAMTPVVFIVMLIALSLPSSPTELRRLSFTFQPTRRRDTQHGQKETLTATPAPGLVAPVDCYAKPCSNSVCCFKLQPASNTSNYLVVFQQVVGFVQSMVLVLW